jgi:hypothetical protein
MKTAVFAALLLLSVSSSGQIATVSGVVTYQFNSNVGNRPDLGAEVYLIDSAKVSGKIDFTVLDTSQRVKSFEATQRSYEKVALQYEEMARQLKNDSRSKLMYEDRVKDALKKRQEVAVWTDSIQRYGSNGDLSALDRNVRVHRMLLSLDQGNSIKKNVDANGNYSIITSPGIYYVFIKSKNRTSTSGLLEKSGNVYFQRVELKDGQRKDVSYNFSLD